MKLLYKKLLRLVVKRYAVITLLEFSGLRAIEMKFGAMKQKRIGNITLDKSDELNKLLDDMVERIIFYSTHQKENK